MSNRRRMPPLAVRAATHVTLGLLALARPAAAADVAVRVELSSPEIPGRTSLQTLVLLECDCDEPGQGVEAVVVATLRELFPLHTLRPAGAAPNSEFRLDVALVSDDAALQRTALRLRLFDQRGGQALDLGDEVTLELSPAALRVHTQPILARTQEVLTEGAPQILQSLLREVPLATVEPGRVAVTCPVEDPQGCRVAWLDTGLRTDEIVAAEARAPLRHSLHGRYVFSLQWGSELMHALRFVLCGASDLQIAGPILALAGVDDVASCVIEELRPSPAAPPRPEVAGTLHLEQVHE